VSIEKQHTETRLHKEYLDSERQRLRQLTDQLEADKARARTERQLLRESSDLERMRLEVEHERQLMEWAEVEKERRHQLTLRQNDNSAARCQLVCCIALLCLTVVNKLMGQQNIENARDYALCSIRCIMMEIEKRGRPRKTW